MLFLFVLSLPFTRLAAFLRLMSRPLFGGEMRRRLNALLKQTLVLYLLLVLYHPLPLFANQRFHLLFR